MSDSLRITDHLFDDAEALVQRVEHACRVETSEQAVYEQITTELLPVSAAVTAILWVIDEGETRILARNGIGVLPDSESLHGVLLPEIQSRHSTDPRCFGPPFAKWADPLRLDSTEQLAPQTVIGLTLQFEKAMDAALSHPLCELSETILGLASGVYLRHRFGELRIAWGEQSQRDDVIDQLNAGSGFAESLGHIAATVARETGVDRTAIVRLKGSSATLLVSSTQPRVDRRARQVRLLETLVSKAIRRSDQFRYVVGNPEISDTAASDPLFTSALEEYLNDSGCRELRIETIFDQYTDAGRAEPLAAIVLERFRIDDAMTSVNFDHLRVPTFAAIRRAFERAQFNWGTLASQLITGGLNRRMMSLGGVLLLIAFALVFVPADLKIPVEGRLLTATHQRLYAPANGTVIELKVSNGQSVDQGQPLLRIRSASLDQQQRQLEGALATAQSKLAVVAAARTKSREDHRGASPNSLASADEQVLKTEVQGLQAELDLVLRQQSELSLFSPIAGQVDRWDLQQTLSGRPVMHGQYLFDIVSDVDGWIVELDIPDIEAQYVVDAQDDGPCEVSFRLRSGPESQYHGSLEKVSDVTQFDATGRPVVRASFGIDAEDEELRFGATVIAQVHCGPRPLGFIWFRSVIQWARQIDWI